MKRGKKIKAVKKEMPKVKRSKAGMILTIIALAIMAVNIVFIFTSMDWILKSLEQIGMTGVITGEALFTYAILWLVLAIIGLMLLLVYQERKTRAWWLMLVLGIITIIASRIEAGILFIIAAFVYKKSLK
jgi:hypothetical protein